MSKKLTIISLDGHCGFPEHLWSHYLDRRYHEYLPSLYEENRAIRRVMTFDVRRTHSDAHLDLIDPEGAYRGGGVEGYHDPQVRLAEMDREGIAAEFCFDGDPRVTGLFFQSSNTRYPADMCNAGVRAYNRWLHDAFGFAKDRLLPVAIVGHAVWPNIRDMVAELDWCADRGFLATSMPGYIAYPGEPELWDPYWDPFWARCEERGIALWVHAGHGEGQGEMGRGMFKVGAGLNDDESNFGELMGIHMPELANGGVFNVLTPRRAMWQLMMGGVFDRFPGLKLVLNEIYIDWMPWTLRYLDKAFEANRATLPCKRRPSEYWRDNGIISMSFPRRSEVKLRHEVGIETVTFGRDYPHPEGTWPNTRKWLRDVFDGVPEKEVRMILGENVIGALKLDGAAIDAVADRIGPPAEEILGGPAVDPKLIEHFDLRAQYLAPPEDGDARVPEMDLLIREDVWKVGGLMTA